MGRTKDLLDHMTKEELLNMQILYEVIGAECDDR
jgi:hypothetical protein